MRQVDAILARFPGPVTLQPSRLKMLALFLGSLVFVAGGAAVLIAKPDDFDSGDALIMWLAILFFGLCALVAVVAMLPGAGSLTLAREGFEICNLFRRTLVPWRDVSDFRVMGLPGVRNSLVGFDVLTAGTGPERRGATKLPGALPDNYQIPKEDLAALMAGWRERALGQRAWGNRGTDSGR